MSYSNVFTSKKMGMVRQDWITYGDLVCVLCYERMTISTMKILKHRLRNNKKPESCNRGSCTPLVQRNTTKFKYLFTTFPIV